MLPGSLKKCVSTDDVRLDKLTGAVDGAVDMGLGGEMHDPLRTEVGKSLAHGIGIADVRLKKCVIRISFKILQRTRIACVGELVDVEDLMSFGHEEMYEIGADEACSSGDEDFHSKWVEIVLTRFKEME